MAALLLHVYVIAQDPNVPLATPAFRRHLAALTGPCMYYDAIRLRQSCAVVHGSTLVWGALEAALVFALLVRLPLSVLYQTGGGASFSHFHSFVGLPVKCWGQYWRMYILAQWPSYRRSTPAGRSGQYFFGIQNSVLISVDLL